VWVEGQNDFCFIIPLCEECAQPSKLHPNYPQYFWTNASTPIMVGDRKERCKCTKDLMKGEVYFGQFKVTNVEGSHGDHGGKLRDWKRCTGLDDVPYYCQMQNCQERARDGAHMWLEGRHDFCFILPMCIAHNRGAKEITHPTLSTAKLVVRADEEVCTSGCKK